MFLNSPHLSGNRITIWILYIYRIYLRLWNNSRYFLSFHLINILNCLRIDEDSSVPTSWDAIFDCVVRNMFRHKWKRWNHMCGTTLNLEPDLSKTGSVDFTFSPLYNILGQVPFCTTNIYCCFLRPPCYQNYFELEIFLFEFS